MRRLRPKQASALRCEIPRRTRTCKKSRRADGVILSTTGAEQVQLLQEHHIPVVLVDRMIPGIQADSVVNDVYDGGRKLIQHLHLSGYRNIAFIGGTPENSTIAARLAGCRDAAREAGLALTGLPGRLDRASGEAIVASLDDTEEYEVVFTPLFTTCTA